MKLIDHHGRVHDDLRISVTDRCNLRCTYCMPELPVWFERKEILSFEEILRLVRVFVAHGVRKLRLTGGEPLLRRDLPLLIRMLAETAPDVELSLTTNGILLGPMAEELARAGLRRVNVSLDTLQRELYARLSRRDRLDRVLEGLAQAGRAGLNPVKVNAVLVQGINDGEAESLAEHSRQHGWELRFIEFMPLGNDETWAPSRVVRGEEIRRRIDSRWPLVAERAGDPNAPATRYLYRDGQGAVGFIDSVSRPFCSTCSRIRLTADGKLRVCLYDDNETDLKRSLRSGATSAELLALIETALMGKGRGGALEILERQAAIPLRRSMHQIGG